MLYQVARPLKSRASLGWTRWPSAWRTSLLFLNQMEELNTTLKNLHGVKYPNVPMTNI